jgi:hypothetical protein
MLGISQTQMSRWQSYFLTSLEERRLTVLALVTLWQALEFIALGPFSYVNGYDIGLYASTPQALKLSAGLWYPEGVAGFDLAASQHIVPMDFLLYRVLPGFAAYQIYVLIGLGSAGLFTYLLLHHQLGLRGDVSLVAGIVYGTMMAVDYYSYTFNYALIPAVIWMLGAVWRRPLLLAIPGVILLALIYASFSRVVFAMPFVPFAALLWYSVVAPRREIRFWFFMLLFWLVYAVTKLPEVWSLLLHLPLSHRPLHPDKTHGVGLALADTFEYFAGLFSWKYGFGVPLLFLILTPVAARRIGSTYARLLIALLAIPVIVLGVMVLLRTLPIFIDSGLSTFSLPRFRFVAVFLVAAGCGLALQQWHQALRGSWTRTIMLSLLAATLSLSLLGKASKLSQWSYTGGFAANYDNGVMHDLAARIDRQGNHERIGVYNIFNGSFQGYGMETLGGWYSLLPIRYGQFLDRLNGQDKDQWLKDGVGVWNTNFNLDLASLANMKYLVSFLPFENPKLRQLHGPERTPSQLSNLDQGILALKFNFGLAERYYVYENPHALPRFFLTNRVRIFPNEAKLLTALAAATLTELRNTAFLEGQSPNVQPNFQSGSVNEVTYSSDRIVLDVEADGPAFLVTINSYSPFWKARIDGREVSMRPAYHTFWGLEVPAGRHRIEWTYEPPYKKIGFLDLRWFWSFRLPW